MRGICLVFLYFSRQRLPCIKILDILVVNRFSFSRDRYCHLLQWNTYARLHHFLRRQVLFLILVGMRQELRMPLLLPRHLPLRNPPPSLGQKRRQFPSPTALFARIWQWLTRIFLPSKYMRQMARVLVSYAARIELALVPGLTQLWQTFLTGCSWLPFQKPTRLCLAYQQEATSITWAGSLSRLVLCY